MKGLIIALLALVFLSGCAENCNEYGYRNQSSEPAIITSTQTIVAKEPRDGIFPPQVITKSNLVWSLTNDGFWYNIKIGHTYEFTFSYKELVPYEEKHYDNGELIAIKEIKK